MSDYVESDELDKAARAYAAEAIQEIEPRIRLAFLSGIQWYQCRRIQQLESGSAELKLREATNANSN